MILSENNINIRKILPILGFEFYPNLDIESLIKVHVLDMAKEFTKTEYTSLVIRVFEDFLGILRASAYIVISKLGIGFYKNFL